VKKVVHSNPLRPFWGLYVKEFTILLDSPIGYLVGFFFLGFSGVWFFLIQQFFAADQASFRGYFGIFPLVFLLVIPSLTMRVWSEERKQGTFELLLTLPLSTFSLVGAKLSALTTFFTFMLVATLPVIFLVLPFGEFDSGPIVSQYLGSFLLGLSGLSLGQFVSSKTSNQISAFLITATVLMFFTLADGIGIWFSGTAVQRLFNLFSFQFRSSSFVRGIIDTRDVFFFLLVTLGFFLLTIRSLEKEKWS
jgi:ABC-2 type transport system permease protein